MPDIFKIFNAESMRAGYALALAAVRTGDVVMRLIGNIKTILAAYMLALHQAELFKRPQTAVHRCQICPRPELLVHLPSALRLLIFC